MRVGNYSEMTVTAATIGKSVQELGLAGQCLCVHASLRSFGWVDGGAVMVVDGLLREGCTVLVPAFADVYRISPPDNPYLRPARNAYDYDRVRAPMPGDKLVYSPD